MKIYNYTSKKFEVKIDMSAFEHNVRLIQSVSESPILPIIKSDGYGHGIVRIAKALSALGVDFIGVGDLSEAYLLRRNGIKEKLLVLLGNFPEEDIYDLEDISIVVHNIWQIEKFKKDRVEAKIHLKVDTGMGRLGVKTDELKRALSLIKDSSLYLEGVMSHFAFAEGGSYFADSLCEIQIGRFKETLDTVYNFGFSPKFIHMSNSASFIKGNIPKENNLTRIGLLLYGVYPKKEFIGSLDIKPVMSITSSIISIKDFGRGENIGYSGGYITEEPKRIGIIPFGYGNGYLRAASNRGFVGIFGKKARICGFICMDLMMVDLTDIDASFGDEVTILGKSKDLEIRAEDIAEFCDTNPYEVLCSFGAYRKRSVLEEVL